MPRLRKNTPLRLLSVGTALAAALASTALAGVPAAFAEPENGWYEVDGERYWYDNGVMATSKEVYDPETNAWYWFDADGTMAHDKDVYLPAGNKWVRYDSEGHMVKGEDFRYGGWYWFDPTTGEMLKGFVFVPSNGGKWVFYDYVTGLYRRCERRPARLDVFRRRHRCGDLRLEGPARQARVLRPRDGPHAARLA